MAVSARISLLLLLSIGMSCVLVVARPGPAPGAASYPSEEENVIPDYAYDNEEDNGKSELVGSWKSIPVASPEKLYDDEVLETTALVMESEMTSTTTSTAAPESAPKAELSFEATPEAPLESVPKAEVSFETAPEYAPEATPKATSEENKAADVAGAVRAVEVAGSAGAAGAAAAVRAVEVVKAAFESTEVPDSTTTTFAVESGRSLGSGSFRDEKPMGDAPTPTIDQNLYGFSKFLHDLLQVPVQVMRSVSSYLSGAFNSRHDVPGAPTAPQNDHGLTSAMLSQSF